MPAMTDATFRTYAPGSIPSVPAALHALPLAIV